MSEWDSDVSDSRRWAASSVRTDSEPARVFSRASRYPASDAIRSAAASSAVRPVPGAPTSAIEWSVGDETNELSDARSRSRAVRVCDTTAR